MLRYMPVVLAGIAGILPVLTMLVRPVVHAKTARRIDTWVLALLALVAVLSIAALPSVASQVVWRARPFTELAVASVIGVTLLVDRVSLVMLFAVAIVGLAVYRYATRYLLGEASQGRFLGWLGLTLAAVQWLVLSGDLLQLGVTWALVSASLHRLLVHYGQRTRAVLAAHTKFLTSRLGDVGLVFACAMLAVEFGTLDLASLIETAHGPLTSSSRDALAYAGYGLAFAAMCKSAQLPVHAWLPDTLEAPTPVSALMHAGIVNAGGFLLIRTSPLLEHAPGALNVLVVVGALTATVGTLTAGVQVEAKRALAWSTVGQMGFMVLQCGLGAFASALVHLVGHGFYKAYAFLRSGELTKVVLARRDPAHPARALAGLALGLVFALGVLGALYAGFGLDVRAEPGGVTIVTLLALGIAAWFVPTDDRRYALAPRLLAATATALASVALTAIANQGFAPVVARIPAVYERGAIGVVLGFAVGGLALTHAAYAAVAPWLAQRNRAIALHLALRHGLYIGHITTRLSRWTSRRPSAEPTLLESEVAS